MSRLPGDSTFFSNETMAASSRPQAGFGDLASFSSAWGLNPTTATASSSGMYGGNTMAPSMQTLFQQEQALMTSFMGLMASFLGKMQGMNSLNQGQNSSSLGGDSGGLNNNTGGTNNGANGTSGTDGANSSSQNLRKGAKLDGKQLVDVLKQAGFSGEGLKTAWAIAMRESGGNSGAFNGNAGTGDKSYGLFQINMLGSLGPARLKELGLKSNDDLLDPLANAKAAFKMSKGGTDFGAWAVGPHAYRHSAALDAAIQKYLKEFPG
jgi:hypothetical protein